MQHVSVQVSPPPPAVKAPLKLHDSALSPPTSAPSWSQTSATECSPKSSSTEQSFAPPAETGLGIKHQTETQARPQKPGMTAPNKKVPATPDEQLKLEAAMSYRTTANGHQPEQFHQQNPDGQGGPIAVPDSDFVQDVQTRPGFLEEGKRTRAVEANKAAFAANATLQINEPRKSSPVAVKPEVVNGTSLPQPQPSTPLGVSDDRAVLPAVSEGPGNVSADLERGVSSESISSDTALVSKPPTPSETGPTPLVKNKKKKEMPRSRLSTVVFPKQEPTDKRRSRDLINRVHHSQNLNEEQDYLFALFQAKAHIPPRSMGMSTLISTAHKTLTTSNHFLEYEEQMNCRVLKRIYQLQHANKWPLRQLERSAEPLRTATHWDILLNHVKWLSTDYKEERKWKIAAAKRCADWCAEYVASDEEGRSMLRIKATRKPAKVRHTDAKLMPSPCSDNHVDEHHEADAHPTPELIPSMDDDSVSEGFNDDPPLDLVDNVAPASIFALGSDEFTFRMERTPSSVKILDELPLYEPVGISSQTHMPLFKVSPDSEWRTDLLPVSKFATAKLGSEIPEPPRKRSRYDHRAINYYDENDDSPTVPLPPDQTDVALFQPENKHIRDRIHPGHSFRPPTEYPMPSLGFYESRQSSLWTYAEDDELRRLVREYSYNWSLISSCLSPQSKFTSGADRRTPWECFERWIGLEGLPADMAKTPYFRAYSARLEAAQRTVLAQQQAAQQQQQAGNNTPQPLIRRRTTQPMRVERKRTTRHLALLAGMRKLWQKRESVLQKQQQGMPNSLFYIIIYMVC